MTDIRDGTDTGAMPSAWRPGRPGGRFHPPCGVRRPGSILLVVLLVGLAVAWLGDRTTPLPTVEGARGAGTPGWRMLAMFAGVLPLLSLHSRMAGLEAVGTARFHRGRAWRLTVLWATSMAVFTGVCAVSVEGRVLEVMAVALPGWTGLGLLGGRLLGWRQCWILPAQVLCVVGYWGVEDGAGGYPWWDFTHAPVAERPMGLGISLGLLVAGMIAYWVTPWRVRSLLRRW
ncbi:hypothetical protein U9R90_15945 [Streptomyces sp. E11-3]|uniref:hypothetical protein n=1 Tax=Streptomyces sp. E11-3 TaxID=3110112 RepID=UPI00397EB628